MATPGRLVKRIINTLSTLSWIIRVARKPSRENYVTVLKLGSLIIVMLGTYSFMFNVAGALLSGASVNVPYPLNIITVATVAVAIFLLALALALATRGIGRGSRG